MDGWLFVLVVVILAWAYDFWNGMNDAANAIATVISTRALTTRQALILSQMLNFVGALVSTKVAYTIGKGIVDPVNMTQTMIIASLIGAVFCSAIATHRGHPISITHALVGGILGGALASKGLAVIKFGGLKIIGIAMIVSPIAGFLGGGLLFVIFMRVFHKKDWEFTDRFFRRSQILTASFVSFSHGMNDAQNAMGIITAALLLSGFIKEFYVPFWVILGSAFFMALGTQVGGWKVIHTVGDKIARLRPIHGASAEISGSAVNAGASFLGLPISTTHTIVAAVMGVGSAEDVRNLDLSEVKKILMAWLCTIPASSFFAAISFWILNYFLN